MCCRTKQQKCKTALAAERLFQCVVTFYVLSGLKDNSTLHGVGKAFLKLDTLA